MGTLVQIAQAVSPPFAGVLIASVWQGGVLTAVVALALGGLRAVSPAVRMWVWTAVSLLLLALPAGALLGVHGEPGRRVVHLGSSWSVALLSVWAVASLARGVQLAGNAVRLWQLAARAAPVPADGGLASLLRGPRRAMLCVSAELDRPSVAGFFRPRVLLPAGLQETLSAAELEHVVRHEMEHLRRWDDWLNLFQQLALVLFPLNPALVWLNRRLCREREFACDDGVLAATRTRRVYAACLVRLAEDSLARKGFALALGALGSSAKAGARESELMVRVQRILAGPNGKLAGPDGNLAGPDLVAQAGRVRLAVGALGAATLAGALCLARCPQLVSFDGGWPPIAKDVVPERMPAAEAWRTLPVFAAAGEVGSPRGVGRPLSHPFPAPTGRVPGPSLRPVMVNAVWRTRVKIAAARFAPSDSKRTRLRAWPGRGVVRCSTRSEALQVKASAELPPAPPEMRPAMHSADAPAAHLAVTEYEISQPLYAALPWGGGWLILQM